MSYDMSGVWAAKESSPRKEGIYHVQVNTAEYRQSLQGNAMLALHLIGVDDGFTVCYDRMMLSGSEIALGMTKAKLKAIGLKEGSQLDPAGLVGRRCYVAVKFGKPNDKGNTYLEVDIRSRGSKCGYWSEEKPPEKVAEARDSIASNLDFSNQDEGPIDASETPF